MTTLPLVVADLKIIKSIAAEYVKDIFRRLRESAWATRKANLPHGTTFRFVPYRIGKRAYASHRDIYDLPKRSGYVGALAWFKAVQDCIGEPFVFALDEALSRYYYRNGENFEGISVVPEYQGRFEKLAEEKLMYEVMKAM